MIYKKPPTWYISSIFFCFPLLSTQYYIIKQPGGQIMLATQELETAVGQTELLPPLSPVEQQLLQRTCLKETLSWCIASTIFSSFGLLSAGSAVALCTADQALYGPLLGSALCLGLCGTTLLGIKKKLRHAREH